MTMSHFKLFFEMSNLLHVGKFGNLLELFRPMFNGLAVLLFNRRKIRRRSGHFLSNDFCLSQEWP